MDIRGKFFSVGHGLTYAFKISDVIGVNDVHLLYDINRECDMKELEYFYGNKEIDYLNTFADKSIHAWMWFFCYTMRN